MSHKKVSSRDLPQGLTNESHDHAITVLTKNHIPWTMQGQSYVGSHFSKSGILSPWIVVLLEGTVVEKTQMQISPVHNEHNELLSFKSLKSSNQHYNFW